MENVTFFGVMASVEKSIARGECDADGIRFFEDLVSYVENCPFTRSKATKFICKNWRLKPRELTTKWNSINMGEDKVSSTFRSQVSTASKLLYAIFGDITPVIFTSYDDLSFNDKRSRDHLALCLYSLNFEDVCVDGMFIKEVSGFFEDLTPKKEHYSLIEIKDELELLRPLIKPNVYEYLESGGADKLKYIFSTLNQPLTSVRTRSINVDKLDILRYLGFLGGNTVGFRFPADSGVAERVVEVQVPEKHRYKFGIAKKMADALDKRLKDKYTKEDVIQMERLRSSGKLEETYERLAKQFTFLTEDGFVDAINNVNVLLLNDVINGNYDGSNDQGFIK